MKELNQLVRKNILNLAPYSSARNEYSGKEATVFLDANENPYNQPYNRYPDPLQRDIKAKIANIKGVDLDSIFLGNGSDEAIDLVYRCFTEPRIDNVVAIAPTYGMYKVCADINDVEYRSVLLNDKFDIDASEILAACDDHTKVIWLCSPNNPTGNALNTNEIKRVINEFEGIVVLDEAYGDFSSQPQFRLSLSQYPNLIVLNTMSKAWGCASLRLGMAFASPEIIDIFNKVKYPYNISGITQQEVLRTLNNKDEVDEWVKILLHERTRMIEAILLLPICKKVYPSDANFFLAEMTDAQAIYDYLVDCGIIVRNRTRITLCNNCLRITVGTKTENNKLIGALRQYQ